MSMFPFASACVPIVILRSMPSAGSIRLSGAWSNTGQITVSSTGEVQLQGAYAVDDLGSVSATGDGLISLQGTLDGRGGTLALDATTGNWLLDGVVMTGGTITTVDGAFLDTTATSTLDGVTIDGDVRATGTHGSIQIMGSGPVDGAVGLVGWTIVLPGVVPADAAAPSPSSDSSTKARAAAPTPRMPSAPPMIAGERSERASVGAAPVGCPQTRQYV